MRWRRLGRVFVPSGEAPWMRTHAAVPVVEPMGGDHVRVYFSARDEAGRSHTGSLVFDPAHPDRILELSAEAVLAPGELGAFDDSGAMATWLTTHQGRTYLYYIGWNLGVTVPFRNAIGLALRGPDGRFARVAPGPIVDRSMTEPHFCASCCVIPGAGLWRMWYLSCTGWSTEGRGPRHRYHIKYAESADGISWRREGRIAIDYAGPDEYAISRPSVMRDADRWRMWFSHRGGAYRIGYAESHDGLAWERSPELAFAPGDAAAWDGQMVEYPCVFDHRGARYMLYNGNDYGRTGFGLAILE